MLGFLRYVTTTPACKKRTQKIQLAVLHFKWTQTSVAAWESRWSSWAPRGRPGLPRGRPGLPVVVLGSPWSSWASRGLPHGCFGFPGVVLGSPWSSWAPRGLPHGRFGFPVVVLGSPWSSWAPRGRPGLPVPNSPYGLRGRKAVLNSKGCDVAMRSRSS